MAPTEPAVRRVSSSRARTQVGLVYPFGMQKPAASVVPHSWPVRALASSESHGKTGSNRQMLFSPSCSAWSVIAAQSSARPSGSCAMRDAVNSQRSGGRQYGNCATSGAVAGGGGSGANWSRVSIHGGRPTGSPFA